MLLNKTVECKFQGNIIHHHTVHSEAFAQVTSEDVEFQILKNQYVSKSLSLEDRRSQKVNPKGTSMGLTITHQSSVRIPFENFVSELVLEINCGC